MRLAFEKSLPAISNSVDIVLMLGEGFMFAIDAGKKLLDVIIMQTTWQKQMAEASKLAAAITQTRNLKKEYNSLGESIRKSMEFRDKLVDSGDIANAVGNEVGFKEQRKQISVQIRMAEAAQREARQALKDLSKSPVDPSIERMADRSESIRDRFSRVFGGGNAADDESLAKLENSLKRAKKALQETGTVGKETIAEIEEAQRKLLGTIDTEATLTWLDKFKEKTKAAWGAFKDGVMAAIKPVKTLEEKMKELGERLVQIAQSSLARFFDEIAAGTANSEEAFKRFTRTVLSEINRLMSEAIVRQFVTMIAGAFSGSTSVNTSGPTFTEQTMQSPLPGYSQGGIVTGPTAAMIGEGGMNEAVVPLPNGRSIPVQFSKGNAGGDNITININAVDGPSVERMLSSSSGRRAIEGVMRNAKSTRRDLR